MTSSGPKRGSMALKYAIGFLEGLRQAGVVSVPAEPTPDMIAAGAQAAGITPAQAEQAFRAMIKAG